MKVNGINNADGVIMRFMKESSKKMARKFPGQKNCRFTLRKDAH